MAGAFIRSYGLFWRRDEIKWAPGAGNAGQFRLLGRRNVNRPALQVADFRQQRGIYVLFDDYGPYYVGLASERDIGLRLRDHTQDAHAGRWDRFSWFGFRSVLQRRDAAGVQQLGALPKHLLTDTTSTIRDIEALLMMALGTTRTGNVQSMKFRSAEEWTQVPYDDTDYWLARASDLS